MLSFLRQSSSQPSSQGFSEQLEGIQIPACKPDRLTLQSARYNMAKHAALNKVEGYPEVFSWGSAELKDARTERHGTEAHACNAER